MIKADILRYKLMGLGPDRYLEARVVKSPLTDKPILINLYAVAEGSRDIFVQQFTVDKEETDE